MNRNLDANNEILVTSGAYEALYATLQGHTTPGDEWIVIEPFFDCYEPMIRMAGGVPRFIALEPVNNHQSRVLFIYDVFGGNFMFGFFRQKPVAKLPPAIGYSIRKKWQVCSMKKQRV